MQLFKRGKRNPKPINLEHEEFTLEVYFVRAGELGHREASGANMSDKGESQIRIVAANVTALHPTATTAVLAVASAGGSNLAISSVYDRQRRTAEILAEELKAPIFVVGLDLFTCFYAGNNWCRDDVGGGRFNQYLHQRAEKNGTTVFLVAIPQPIIAIIFGKQLLEYDDIKEGSAWHLTINSKSRYRYTVDID
jgi:hypothetical protein